MRFPEHYIDTLATHQPLIRLHSRYNAIDNRRLPFLIGLAHCLPNPTKPSLLTRQPSATFTSAEEQVNLRNSSSLKVDSELSESESADR
ncbi:hypothetical protein CERZMDRAFT_90287 [Cercospora zeae-maydis SCOH1-5]|uniref:Uncharacterized protein n=1 Tax=Cercospora zeae-maydis SCOH1-5 TaxID=717836 RepID=A0A6A6FLW0_9PEZI|nr:hypothetical protein CERZMDRAFT_90287 [Cercospora zeae-maydis SCOH1-5]